MNDEENRVVHIVLHHACTAAEDTCRIVGVYSSVDQAQIVIEREHKETKESLSEYYDFDEDFEQVGPGYCSFGFYGEGLNCDQSWSWQIVSEVVT